MLQNWFTFKHFRWFRNFYSSHSPSSFFVAPSLSVVHPTNLRHFLSRTFCSPRPFGSATSVVFVNCLFSSFSSTAMKSTTSQTNKTVPLYNPHSLKAAIFKTLALKFGNELNHGKISPSTRQAFLSKLCKHLFTLIKKDSY